MTKCATLLNRLHSPVSPRTGEMPETARPESECLTHTLAQYQIRDHCQIHACRDRVLAICASSVLIAVFVSCGSERGPMTGNWLLSLVSGDSLEQRPATISLHQSGDSLSGSVTAAGCMPATVTGIINQNALTIQLFETKATGTLTGVANTAFSSASGTYTITGPSCLSSTGLGTWSAVFVSG